MQLSEVVQQFVTKYISSVDQLEILLLLKQNPSRRWTAGDVARALATDPVATASSAATLAREGLISESAETEPLYQHGARSTDLRRAIDELAAAYPHFRVSIINLIFSKPIDKIRTFADAFLFK